MLWLIDSCQNKVFTDQYHMTISQAQVKSSSRPLTRQRVFYWIVGSSQVITIGEGKEENTKAKFWQKLNPEALKTFLLAYSLHNHILESP